MPAACASGPWLPSRSCATGERSVTAAVLQQYLVRADTSIREATGARAGTTLTGAVVVEQMGMPYWLVMNIGDSRTYRLSQGQFEQISVDHSEVQELVDAGQITAQQATVHPRRHVVTRALGTGDETEADFWLLPVEEGDRVLVCSDGLNAELTDPQILRILSSAGTPQDDRGCPHPGCTAWRRPGQHHGHRGGRPQRPERRRRGHHCPRHGPDAEEQDSLEPRSQATPQATTQPHPAAGP